jgi:hypothetical protein
VRSRYALTSRFNTFFLSNRQRTVRFYRVEAMLDVRSSANDGQVGGSRVAQKSVGQYWSGPVHQIKICGAQQRPQHVAPRIPGAFDGAVPRNVVKSVYSD